LPSNIIFLIATFATMQKNNVEHYINDEFKLSQGYIGTNNEIEYVLNLSSLNKQMRLKLKNSIEQKYYFKVGTHYSKLPIKLQETFANYTNKFIFIQPKKLIIGSLYDNLHMEKNHLFELIKNSTHIIFTDDFDDDINELQFNNIKYIKFGKSFNKTIHSLFGCMNLKHIEIPSLTFELGIKGLKTTKLEYIWLGYLDDINLLPNCPNLKTLVIKNYVPKSNSLEILNKCINLKHLLLTTTSYNKHILLETIFEKDNQKNMEHIELTNFTIDDWNQNTFKRLNYLKILKIESNTFNEPLDILEHCHSLISFVLVSKKFNQPIDCLAKCLILKEISINYKDVDHEKYNVSDLLNSPHHKNINICVGRNTYVVDNGQYHIKKYVHAFKYCD